MTDSDGKTVTRHRDRAHLGQRLAVIERLEKELIRKANTSGRWLILGCKATTRP